MAGVLSLYRDLAGDEVGKETLASAIEIVKHYADEAMRLWQVGAVQPELKLAQRLYDWMLTSWLEPHISLPDIYQRSLDKIGDKATAERIVGILTDHGWLTKLDGAHVVNGVNRRNVWLIHGRKPAS